MWELALQQLGGVDELLEPGHRDSKAHGPSRESYVDGAVGLGSTLEI